MKQGIINTKIRLKTALCGLICMLATTLQAQNPIIGDRYTPDPAPYVHGDTLYLFVDHDEDETLNGYFTMKDWLLYSTVDMVNWTYRGTPLTSATFSQWAKQDNDCWASQCIERNGKWYWYVTATIKDGGYPGIGVAVADNPAGPYVDPIKRPLVKGWFKIDPTVMIDDNGQAYLYYGNNNLWYVKLNQNMTSFNGGENQVNVKNETAFGPHKNDNGDPNFEEASWIYKRGGKYYLEYAAGGVPEHWAYSTASNPSHYYMFYHNGKLPGGGGYKRSTCIEEFTPNEDGTLPFINFTTKGVEPLQSVNPYVRQEAETVNQSQGVKFEGDYNGCYATELNKTDFIKVRGVDFGEEGATRFTAKMRAEDTGTMQVRINAKSGTGTLVGKVTVSATNGEWQDFTCELTEPVKGLHDLFFTFTCGSSCHLEFDCWQFGNASTDIAPTRYNNRKVQQKGSYDLSGRRLQGKSAVKGIGIVDGKKVIR